MTDAVVFLRLPEVLHRVKLSKPQVYKMMARKEFPQQRKIRRSAVWVEAEVTAWQQALLAA